MSERVAARADRTALAEQLRKRLAPRTRVARSWRMSRRWVSNCLHSAGPERTLAVQILKTTAAAALAWVLAANVIGFQQPFLAPYSAVFIVEATVYRSMRYAVQQVASVTAGVLLAAGVAAVIPSTTATLAVALLLGLVVGQYRRFGPSGVWVGVTALLMITFGTVGHPELLLDRVLEIAMGSSLALAINALILPPTHVRESVATAQEFAERLRDLLCDMAEALRSPGAADRAPDWDERMTALEAQLESASIRAREARESAWANMRPSLGRSRTDVVYSESLLSTLRAAVSPIRELSAAVEATGGEHLPFGYPTYEAREAIAELLGVMGTIVALRRDDAAGEDARRAVDRGNDLIADVEKRAQDGGDVAGTIGIATLLRPARQAFYAVAARV